MNIIDQLTEQQRRQMLVASIHVCDTLDRFNKREVSGVMVDASLDAMSQIWKDIQRDLIDSAYDTLREHQKAIIDELKDCPIILGPPMHAPKDEDVLGNIYKACGYRSENNNA